MNLKEYLAKRNTLLSEAEKMLGEGNIEGFDAKEIEIKALDEQWEKYAKAQANIKALKDIQVPENVLENLGGENKFDAKSPENNVENRYGTLEYRKAFMNYCKTGVIDDKFFNADAQTTTTDASAVIPSTIVSEVIRKMETYGQIYNRVRKTNIKGGVEVPILSLKPTATWIGESTPSDRKKVTANTKVTFSYYGLECKVAVSLLADVTTLDMFETTITQIIVEAMVKAFDIAIIKGTGSGQPLGITAVY